MAAARSRRHRASARRAAGSTGDVVTQDRRRYLVARRSSASWVARQRSSTRPTQFFSARRSSGCQNGALYALIALGYTLVYGIIELINFAHGDLFMLGTIFAGVILTTALGQSARPSLRGLARLRASTLVVVMAFCATINVAIEFARLPAAAQRAQAGAADHRGRRELHPPERSACCWNGSAPEAAGPACCRSGALHHRRRPDRLQRS